MLPAGLQPSPQKKKNKKSTSINPYSMQLSQEISDSKLTNNRLMNKFKQGANGPIKVQNQKTLIQTSNTHAQQKPPPPHHIKRPS